MYIPGYFDLRLDRRTEYLDTGLYILTE